MTAHSRGESGFGTDPIVVAYGAGVDSTAMLCGEPISSSDLGG